MSSAERSAIRHFSSVRSMEELRRRSLRQGILMQDVDSGNPCNACGSKCPGFQLHVWRKVCQHCKCPKSNHLPPSRERDNLSAFGLAPVREEMQASGGSGADLKGPHGIPNGEANREKTDQAEQIVVEQVRKQLETTHVDPVEVVHVVDEATFERIEVSSDNDGFKNAVLGLFGGSDGDNEGIPGDERRETSDEEEEEEEEEESSAWKEVAVGGRKPPEGLEFGDVRKHVDGHEETVMDPEKLGFIWTPQGLTKNQVIRYMDSLPKEKVPKIGSPGSDYWMKQQAFQLPEHDTDPEKCHGLDEDEQKKQEMYKRRLETGVMGEGQVAEIVNDGVECWRCHKTMPPGDMAVQAEVGSGCHMWHPACFTCETDGELLVPLIYFYQDDKIFCGRHYGETLVPRCHACDELIFCHHFTVAEGHKWHQKHFCCFYCDQPLAIGDKNQPYVNHDDHIYCTKCFTKEIAEQCHGCGDPIAAGDKHLIHEDTNWHTACFICSRCQAELASMPFYRRDEKYLCPTCFEGAFGKVCAKCGDGIQTSSKSFVLSDKHWHEGCFVCTQCKESMAGRPMVNHETGLYCPTCYHEVLGDKCHGCKKPIGAEGGVTYGSSTFHHQCFSCDECHQTLAGQKFTKSPEGDKQLCLTCFDQLYAKTCSACNQSIVASSSSYMALGDQVWHENCFMCSQCKSPLSGSGFYQRDGELLCPNCG